MSIRRMALAALLGAGVLVSLGAAAQQADSGAPANIDVTGQWLDGCTQAGGVPGVGNGLDPLNKSIAVRQYNCDWAYPLVGPLMGASELKPLVDLCKATTGGLASDLYYFPRGVGTLLHVDCIAYFPADRLRAAQ